MLGVGCLLDGLDAIGLPSSGISCYDDVGKDVTFYRKIQSATGQKPTDFIRPIRLRLAAELLRENRMTITGVSYATGFSSVSYFSRCFRTMFGVTPTQFLEEAKIK